MDERERVIRLRPGQTARIIDSQNLVERAKELAKKKGKRTSPAPKPEDPPVIIELREFVTKFAQETSFVRSRSPRDLTDWILATGNRPTEIAIGLRVAGVSDRKVRMELENLFLQVVPEEIAKQVAKTLFIKLKRSLPDTD